MNLSFMESVEKIRKAYQMYSYDIINEFNLSQIDFDIIMFLNNHKDQCTAKEFSKHKNIKPNVVSFHVDKLVSNGYLEREILSGDRRKIKLIVTSKCKDIIHKGKIMQEIFYQELTKGLDKKDIEEFRKTLNIILNNAKNL